MKHKACMVVLAAMFVAAALPAAALGAGDEKAPTPAQLEQYEIGMALEARKAELQHEQELRKLELEERRIELDHQRRRFEGRHHKDGCGGAVLLLILVVHILLTIWVCKDMREQKIGRALWVPIVLLAGVCGAILYAIVRVGDKCSRPAEPED